MTDDPVALTHDAREGLIANEDSARANAALARLPERYRDAVVLFYRGEQSIAEVATALGISEASARQRVHRGRRQLRELLEPVEATLRATRPAAAFTAACVAAWTAGRPVPAAAAVRPKTIPWLVPVVAFGVLATAAIVAVATGVLSSDTGAEHARAAAVPGRPADPRDGLRRRFPSSAQAVQHVKVPSGAFVVAAQGAAEAVRVSTSGSNLIDLEFRGVPLAHVLHLLSDALDTPVWLTFDTDDGIDVVAHQRPALEVLDDVLARARASRAEVAAVRIAAGGRSDASTLGGERIDLSVRDAPLNYVLTLIEPKLAMPIGRVGIEMPAGAGPDPDESPHVTLELRDVTAGMALERALTQAGLGYELTTGFVIVPE